VSDLEITIVLSVMSSFCALVLAVTLYRITRDVDADLAMLALVCRVGEGVLGAAFLPAVLGLLWLATPAGANALDSASANTLGGFLLQANDWSPTIAAIFFAVGSTLFSYLLLRGRIVPAVLAWLGVLASILVVIILPLQLAGFVGPITQIWYPMLVFEVSLALWLLIKGAAMPIHRTGRSNARESDREAFS
jgi:hypothetical protein